MAGTRAAGPDFARCYGHYRQQTVQYALAHCLDCPKLKACVRLTWGRERAPRARRGVWDEARPAARQPAAIPIEVVQLAT
jgi:hypothetical protein